MHETRPIPHTVFLGLLVAGLVQAATPDPAEGTARSDPIAMASTAAEPSTDC